jgi:hypothetical protein
MDTKIEQVGSWRRHQRPTEVDQLGLLDLLIPVLIQAPDCEEQAFQQFRL